MMNAMTTLRATFDGRVIVPETPVDLPIGQVLEVDVRAAGELRPGSPELVLKLMKEGPPISKEDADELERLIEEGQMPLAEEPVFDDASDDSDESQPRGR
jgi:hypothetical protein